MEHNGAMRIRRVHGRMSYYYSVDGCSTWEQIGDSIELPTEYQTGPLKIGYRIKREWTCEYNMDIIPNVVSGGTVELEAPKDLPVSYFHGGNTYARDSVDFGDGQVTFSSETGGGQQAMLLSKEAYEDNISVQVQLTARQIFGENKYQAGLYLFFMPEEIASKVEGDDDLSTFNLHENSWNNFLEGSTIGAFGDKLHGSIQHTWFYESVIQVDTSTWMTLQGGDTWVNTDGYLRLERYNGYIQAFQSMNGGGWKLVGLVGNDIVKLPDVFASSKVRIGIAVKQNWNSQYHISFIPTISTDTIDSSYADAKSSSPIAGATHADVVDIDILRGYSSSYFDYSNSLVTNRVIFQRDYAVFSSELVGGTDHALLLSNEVFTGSVTFTIEVLFRQIFGTNKYQGGLWLFFADPNAHVENLFATDDPCDWDTFQNSTVALFGDKIHSSITHTWMYSHILEETSLSSSTTKFYKKRSGSTSFQNLDSNLRLQRDENGMVTSYIQNVDDTGTDDGWNTIGSPVELPDEWKTSGVKIGLAWQENYNADYQIAFSTTVENNDPQGTRRGRRNLTGAYGKPNANSNNVGRLLWRS